MKKKNSYSTFGIFAVLLIVIAVAALLVWGHQPFLDPARSFLGLKTNITSGEVVEKLRSASDLTTTKYTIKLVARSDTPGNWWAFGQDYQKMLLVAKGTVAAGIDLSQLDTSAVSVSKDGKNITVSLPSVMIRRRDYSLSNDPKDTYVYNASSGWFANTTNRQTELRGTANEELVKAACKGGIMQRATTDAKFAIEQLLKTIVPNVNVTVVSGPGPSVAECMAR